MSDLVQTPGPAGQLALRVLAWALAAASAVAAIFPFATRAPLAVSFALVLPALAVALVFIQPAAFDLTSRRSGRPYLDAAALVAAAFIFALAANAGVYDWRSAAVPAGLAALLLALLSSVVVAPKVRIGVPYVVLYFAALGGAYAYGAVVLADVRLDRAPAQVFETRVADRYVTYGRHSSYHLKLEPFGPRAVGVTASVGSSAYYGAHIGDTICAAYHPGLLRLDWWNLAPCPGA